jgi:hypothetical protein
LSLGIKPCSLNEHNHFPGEHIPKLIQHTCPKKKKISRKNKQFSKNTTIISLENTMSKNATIFQEQLSFFLRWKPSKTKMDMIKWFAQKISHLNEKWSPFVPHPIIKIRILVIFNTIIIIGQQDFIFND